MCEFSSARVINTLDSIVSRLRSRLGNVHSTVDFFISTRSQIFKESEVTVAESLTTEVGHEFGCDGASHNGERKYLYEVKV